MRLGTTYGEGHPNAQTARIFADLVHKHSNGQLVLELFCDRKLGDAPQLLEQLTFGGVALAMVDSLTLSQQIPQLSELLQTTPGLAPAQAQQELEGRWDTISELLQQEQLDLLAIYLPDYQIIATAARPVQTPEDFAGLRLYKPNQLAVQNGAHQVQWEDLPQSIANDFADGAEMTLLEYTDACYQLVMPYLTMQSEMYRVDFLLVSEASMGLLTPETQRLIQNIAQKTLKPQEELLHKAQHQLQSIEDTFYSYQTNSNYSAFYQSQNVQINNASSLRQALNISIYLQRYCDDLLLDLLAGNREYYQRQQDNQGLVLLLNLSLFLALAGSAVLALMYLHHAFSSRYTVCTVRHKAWVRAILMFAWRKTAQRKCCKRFR